MRSRQKIEVADYMCFPSPSPRLVLHLLHSCEITHRTFGPRARTTYGEEGETFDGLPFMIGGVATTSSRRASTEHSAKEGIECRIAERGDPSDTRAMTTNLGVTGAL